MKLLSRIARLMCAPIFALRVAFCLLSWLLAFAVELIAERATSRPK